MKPSGILCRVSAKRSNDSWKRQGRSILSADITQIVQERSVLSNVWIKKDDHSQRWKAGFQVCGKKNVLTWKNEKLATSSSTQIVNKVKICTNMGPSRKRSSIFSPWTCFASVTCLLWLPVHVLGTAVVCRKSLFSWLNMWIFKKMTILSTAARRRQVCSWGSRQAVPPVFGATRRAARGGSSATGGDSKSFVQSDIPP